MGLFDRLRGKDKSSPDAGEFEALMAEMTRLGVVIITRDNGTYTVYWARRQHDPLLMQSTVDALKRSVEGRGETALEAILDCREQAQKQHAEEDAGGVVVAKTVVKTTTTTQTETRTEVPKGTTIEPSPVPDKPDGA
jgi:hypothetical protein